jgi:hypothetical protein
MIGGAGCSATAGAGLQSRKPHEPALCAHTQASFEGFRAKASANCEANNMWHVRDRPLLKGSLSGMHKEMFMKAMPLPKKVLSNVEASARSTFGGTTGNMPVLEARDNSLYEQDFREWNQRKADLSKKSSNNPKNSIVAKTFFDSHGANTDITKAQADMFFKNRRPFGGEWEKKFTDCAHPVNGMRYDAAHFRMEWKG